MGGLIAAEFAAIFARILDARYAVIMLNRRSMSIVLLVVASAMISTGCRGPNGSASKAASNNATAGTYINVSDIPYATLIPAPSAKGSAMSRGEIELLLGIRSDAAAHLQSRTVSEETISVWTFAEVMGPGFEKTRMPITDEVMKNVIKDARAVTEAAKDHFERIRPPFVDERVKPWVEVPESGSYPSGHSTRAMVWAFLLAEVEPSKAEALRRRASLIGLDRITGGVHFPTDVAAGFGLGEAIAMKVLQNPKFQADLARVKAEWSAVKGSSAGAGG